MRKYEEVAGGGGYKVVALNVAMMAMKGGGALGFHGCFIIKKNVGIPLC